MELQVEEKGNLVFKKVYTGLTLRSNDNEELSICMRDSGFEFTYEGEKYSAQQGKINKIK